MRMTYEDWLEIHEAFREYEFDFSLWEPLWTPMPNPPEQEES